MKGGQLQAVILSAGSGKRLRRISPSKPLTKLLGLPLLERNIRLLKDLGVSRVVVVTGHRRQHVETWCKKRAPELGVEIVTAHNDEWETTENGRSLHAAAGHIDQPFVLLMADHVYSPELLSSLVQSPPPAGGAVLAVDRNTSANWVDPDDVTRVVLRGRRIKAVGKGLAKTDGFDTGAFFCDPAVFSTVARSIRSGNTSLSRAMQMLADDGRLEARFVDGMFWQDVDTPADFRKARRRLIDAAADKATDGPVSRFINRPVSKRITPVLVAAGMTPNAISVLSLLLSLGAAALLAQPNYGPMALGGVLAQLASIVDGCDGEVARITMRSSKFGGWFDAQLDRYADVALLGALTWNLLSDGAGLAAYIVGIAAIAGSFVTSYGAHKADRVLKEKLRIGRDLRVFVIMIGALAGSAWLALIVIAVTMNAVVVWRMTQMRPLLDRPVEHPVPTRAPSETVPSVASVAFTPVASKPLTRPDHPWATRPVRPGLRTPPHPPTTRPRP
jgi:choline kinase/phosphatidylglycerophosphate synthase